jgi:iron complex outermembrane recepter protein
MNVMKKILALLLTAVTATAFCQTNSLNGIVKNEDTQESISGAVVQIDNTFTIAITDKDGKFAIQNLSNGTYHLIVTHIAFEKLSVEGSIPSSSETVIMMKKKIYLSEEVTISATRATAKSAVAYTDVNKDELERNNLGQDLPYLLNMTPSVVVTSDAGTGIGYTGIRIRGSDASRVNVTLNGVPVNDAEAHGVYWVDLPDLASSVDNIQIQRGVGTSTNGVGAFGGSVNIQTQKFSALPYGNLSSSFGSFNTWKTTFGFGTGLLNKKFAFDGRLSKITSDGYIDRSTSDLKSFYLSGGYYGSKSSLRVIVMSGKEKTYQSWYGVPESRLTANLDSLIAHYYRNLGVLYFTAEDSLNLFNSDNRTYNYYTYKNQSDNYRQDYYQLLYSKQLIKNWDLNLTAHYTKGKGYYEEYKNSELLSNYGLPAAIIGTDTFVTTNLIRQKWLDNDFYGLTWSVNKTEKRWAFTLGGAISTYIGKHFNEIISAQYLPTAVGIIPFRYEDNDARKHDLNFFGKFFFDATPKTHLFADLQVRAVSYQFPGLNETFERPQRQMDLSFFNPKAGVTYDLNMWNSIYAFVSMAGKEPVRNDYIYYTPSSHGKPEYMTDIEAGYKFRSKKTTAGINFYMMHYKNQLVLTGKINDVGEPLRQNVYGSYRTGIEAEAAFLFSEKVNAGVNVTLSNNKIESHTEYIFNYDDYTYSEIPFGKTDIAFSPSVISGVMLNYSPAKSITASVQSKYVGKQFLDNTSDKDKKLDAYFVNDLRLNWKVKTNLFREFALTLLVNNIIDEKYESNGYTYSYIYGGETIRENYYYPQAGRNFLAGVTAKF